MSRSVKPDRTRVLGELPHGVTVVAQERLLADRMQPVKAPPDGLRYRGGQTCYAFTHRERLTDGTRGEHPFLAHPPVGRLRHVHAGAGYPAAAAHGTPAHVTECRGRPEIGAQVAAWRLSEEDATDGWPCITG